MSIGGLRVSENVVPFRSQDMILPMIGACKHESPDLESPVNIRMIRALLRKTVRLQSQVAERCCNSMQDSKRSV